MIYQKCIFSYFRFFSHPTRNFIIFVLIPCLLFPILTIGATRTSTASGGNWTNGATWVGGNVPTAGDNVVIATTTGAVTVNANVSCVNLTINSQGILTLSGTNTLSLSGDLSMPRPANGFTNELNVNAGTLNVSGGFTMSATSGTRYATMNITTGTANLNNFTSGGNSSQIIFVGNGLVKFSGTLTGTRITIVQDIGTVQFDGTVDQPIWKTAYNNLTISGSGIKSLPANTVIDNVLSVESGANLNLDGFILTMNGSGNIFQVAGTLQTSASTVRFSGTSDQNIPGLSYFNLTFNNTGTKILDDGSILTITGDWVCSAPVTMNGTAGANISGNLTGNGAITMNTGTLTIAGNWTNSGSFSAGTSKVFYNGTNPQNVRQLTYYDLELAGTGIKTAGNSLTVEHIFTLNSGVQLDMGNRTLTLSGSGTPLVNAGTITGGTWKVDYASTSAQNVAGIDYYNLTFSDIGTKTIMNGDQINVTSTWLNNSPAVFDGTAGMNLTGNLIGSGDISMGSGTIAIEGNWTNSGILTPGTGLVRYSALGDQTMQTINYYNLSLSGSGIKSFSSGAPQVTNVLTVDNGVELNYGNRTLELTGAGSPLVVNGTISGTTGTISFSGLSAQQIPPLTYRNLACSGGAKTINTGDNLIIELSWDINSGTTLTGTASAVVSNDITGNGNITMGSGTLTLGRSYTNTGTFAANTSTFSYNDNTNNQDIATTINYYNLSLSGGATKRITNATISVANNWDIGNQASLIGTGGVDVGGNIGGVGNISIVNGTISLGGSWSNSGTFDAGTGTVVYDGSTQDVVVLPYYNLQISAAGTKTMTGDMTVSNILTLNSPATLDLSSTTLTLPTNPNPFVSTGTVLPSSSTVNYTSLSVVEIAAVDYFNLDCSGGDRTLPALATVGIAGVFTPGAGTYTITDSTVNFNGDASQTIPSFTYDDVLISGVGEKLIDSAVNVNTITIENGAQVNLFSSGSGILNVGN